MPASESVGLAGVIIGGVIGVAGSLIPQVWQTYRARKSARAIARAYISGILNMCDVRGYDAVFKKHLADLKDGNKPVMKMFGGKDADELQTVLMAQVGLLDPDTASDVVKFTNVLKALKIDLAAMAAGEFDELPEPTIVSILQDDVKALHELKRLGGGLVGRLS
jgi:hypothetical protein